MLQTLHGTLAIRQILCELSVNGGKTTGGLGYPLNYGSSSTEAKYMPSTAQSMDILDTWTKSELSITNLDS